MSSFTVVAMRAGAYASHVGQVAVRAVLGGARLELRGPENARVHYLQDRPLERGDEIEVLLSDGYWLRGHYDWSGVEARWAGLRIELGGPWQDNVYGIRPPSAVMALHPDAIARRPR